MDGQQPQSDKPQWQFNPGETISPRQTAQAPPLVTAPQPPAAPTPPVPPAPMPAPPAPTPEAPSSQPTPPLPELAPQPTQVTAPPQSDAPQLQTLPATAANEPGGLTWSASEFISRQKSGGWHAMIVLACLVVAVLMGVVFRDFVSASVILLAGVVLSYYGSRKPQQVNYQLDNQGLTIGNKHLVFSDFKAFSVVPDGAFETIQLIPTKRFMPMTTLFFDPQDGDKIINILGAHLPHQERKPDAIDSLMRRIRF